MPAFAVLMRFQRFQEMDRWHRLSRVWILYDTEDSGSLPPSAFTAMVADVLFAAFGRDASAHDPWVTEAGEVLLDSMAAMDSTDGDLANTASNGTSGAGAPSIGFDAFARAVFAEQGPALFSTQAFARVVSIAISPRLAEPEPGPGPEPEPGQWSSRGATAAASTELAVSGDVFMHLLMDRTDDLVTVGEA